MKDIIYTRKYLGQDGQERKEYITVGHMFEKEGRISILMKSWINPSALANDKGEVWLNVYDHKTKASGSKTLYKGAETVKAVQSAVNPTIEAEKEISGDLPF